MKIPDRLQLKKQNSLCSVYVSCFIFISFRREAGGYVWRSVVLMQKYHVRRIDGYGEL